MSTNNDGWILMSERKPTEADLPVWVYDIDGTLMRGPMLFLGHAPESWTHWRRAAADMPAPPREKTQGEKDHGAFISFHASGDGCSASAARAGWDRELLMYWHAALACERAEVAKMLPPVRPLVSYGTGIIETERAIEAIRARCGGGK